MAQDFNNLSAKEIVDYIGTRDPGNFGNIQKIMEALNPDLHEEVVNILEKEMVGSLRKLAENPMTADEITNAFNELSTYFGEAAAKKGEAEALDNIQAASQLIKYIAGTKGDATNLVLKEAVKALAELPDADYNKLHKVMQALTKGYNAAQPPAALRPIPSKKRNIEMAQDFNTLSAKEIVDYIGQNRPEDFSDIQKIIEVLKPALRKEVIDIIENDLVHAVRGFAEEPELVDYIEQKFHELSHQFNNAAEKREEARELNDIQIFSQLLKYVAEAKGEAAHPALKETVKTLAALSDADYNKTYKIIKAMVQGYDNSLKPAPPQSPPRGWKM